MNATGKNIGEHYTQQLEVLKSKFSAQTEYDKACQPVVWVKGSQIVDVLKFVKSDGAFAYEFMADLTCYDNMGTPEEAARGRFVMVYNLYSPQYHCRMRIKAPLREGESISTVCGVWETANWAEREVFDMFGVKFEGHPDLRRILMDVRWEGHPLRKDYPLRKYQLFNEPEQIPAHLLKD